MNRRHFLTGLLATTAIVATGPSMAFAQLAPIVSEQDVSVLFGRAVNTVENGLVGHHSYNLQSEAQIYYNNATNDKQRALVVSFVAMGGLDLADQAAREAVSQYTTYYERLSYYNEDYIVNPKIKQQVVDKYANMSSTYGSQKMPFSKVVATVASDLLDSAYNKHKLNFLEYMNKIYLPYKTTNKTDLAIKGAAISVGLGNTTGELYTKLP